VQNFQNVDVWRKAHELTLAIYRATDKLPKTELFGVTVQLRRAAVAVPTRIAEGCGRENDSEFANQLHKARGASAELEYLLLLCRDLAYLPPADYESLVGRLVEVQKMISGLVRKL
jgi:four helix bundle protein